MAVQRAKVRKAKSRRSSRRRACLPVVASAGLTEDLQPGEGKTNCGIPCFSGVPQRRVYAHDTRVAYAKDTYKVVWSEEGTVGASSDAVHGACSSNERIARQWGPAPLSRRCPRRGRGLTWLEIDEDGSWNIFAGTSLVVVDVDCVSRCAVVE